MSDASTRSLLDGRDEGNEPASAADAGVGTGPADGAGSPTARPAARAALLALSFGHACSDLVGGAVSALLPFLVVERGYTYGDVGIFVLASSVAGGLLQPLFGHHGDRTPARWLLPVGLVLGGLGLGAIGVLDSYVAALIAVAAASVGVAAFHPEGARWARVAAGTNVVTGMSVFSVGGSVGFAVSPLLVTAIVAPLGLTATPLLAVLPLTAAVAVSVAVRRLHVREQARVAAAGPSAVRLAVLNEWWPFGRLAFMYGVLSAVVSGVMAYVPLFLVTVRDSSPGAANVMTTVFLVSAAFGTLLGGRVADRFGRRLVLLVPPLLLTPALAALPSLSFAAMVPLVAVIGLCCNASVSTAIVLAQEYLPGRIGLASGITVGASVGVGGIGAALLGLLGDATSPATVIYALAALPAAIFVLATTLPRPAAIHSGSRWGLSRAA